MQSQSQSRRIAGAGPARGAISLWASLSAVLATLLLTSAAGQRTGAALDQLNVDRTGLALEGYDPVAYFPVGGSRAAAGSAKFSVTLRGVSYRFTGAAHRTAFLETPEVFEPDYGGWCAWAMAKGDKVEIDPKSFLVEKGRLLVFYDGFLADTRKKWKKKGGDKLTPVADSEWSKMLGRKPVPERLPPADNPPLGLEGRDPLTIGEGLEPIPGLDSITTLIKGTRYRFSTLDNRVAFLLNPEDFLPAPPTPTPEPPR